MPAKSVTLSLCLAAVTLSLLEAVHGQSDYDYGDYDYTTADDFDCEPGGADVGTWQCDLCGPVKNETSPLACVANYTGFDHYYAGTDLNELVVGWSFLDSFSVSNDTAAVQPSSPPNHIISPSAGNISFYKFWSDITVGYGRIYNFDYGCSNSSGFAVPCTLTLTGNFIRNWANGSQDLVKASGTFNYAPALSSAAPMASGNFTPIADAVFENRSEYTIQKYADTYEYAAVQDDGCPVNLHLDNFQTSWWYPW